MDVLTHHQRYPNPSPANVGLEGVEHTQSYLYNKITEKLFSLYPRSETQQPFLSLYNNTYCLVSHFCLVHHNTRLKNSDSFDSIENGHQCSQLNSNSISFNSSYGGILFQMVFGEIICSK